MLKITIPGQELWDEKNQRFLHTQDVSLVLEHSLISLSKWEAAWKKPFLTKENKTDEETIDYIRHMTITQNVDPIVYERITQDVMDEVTEYIQDPMTATTFKEDHISHSREIITAELIYFWMINFQVPIDRERWHLNRLLTLIRVCTIKNQKAKPRGRKDILRQNKALNDARKAKLNTNG